MADLPELQPRTNHSSDGLENAELRVKWLETQRDCFTPEGYELALNAMYTTVEEHRARNTQVQSETPDINPLQTS